MRHLLALLGVAFALSLSPAQAADSRIGTIVSAGTSITNASTAAPFTIKGSAVAVQCTAACYVVASCGTSATAATSSDGVKLSADQLYDVDFACSATRFLAMIPVSGSADAKVFARTIK